MFQLTTAETRLLDLAITYDRIPRTVVARMRPEARQALNDLVKDSLLREDVTTDYVPTDAGRMVIADLGESQHEAAQRGR
jgi:cation diffusion facilitator CzcD-associated flavoprotein CzcO